MKQERTVSPLTFGEKLKEIRVSRYMSQQDLADLLHTSKQVISRYELGQTTPKISVAAAWCQILNISLDSMLNDELPISTATPGTLPANILPLPKTRKIPLLGTIACGEPITAVENVDQYIDVAEDIRCTFALRCKGDSMIDARIMDGDVVYIREQPQVENGEIAAVLIGDEATLKRVYLSDDVVQLVACNAKYSPLVYTGSQLEQLRILGKAVAFTSIVR